MLDTGLRDKVGYLLARVRHLAADEGFALNPKKTRVRFFCRLGSTTSALSIRLVRKRMRRSISRRRFLP